MTLQELYQSDGGVLLSQIPAQWRESFSLFMFGSTHGFVTVAGREVPIYWAGDFRAWYTQNKEAIVREAKVKAIFKKKV